jgi:hypothetical protein
MNVTFIDIEDEANRLNGTAIEDGERLSQLLQSLRGQAPFHLRTRGGKTGLSLWSASVMLGVHSRVGATEVQAVSWR